MNAGCEGAPLLPLLYVITNLSFNITVLNVVKKFSAVVASLVVMLSGSFLFHRIYELILDNIHRLNVYIRRWHIVFMNWRLVLLALCSASFNLYSITSIAISTWRRKLKPPLSHWEFNACIGSCFLLHSTAFKERGQNWLMLPRNWLSLARGIRMVARLHSFYNLEIVKIRPEYHFA